MTQIALSAQAEDALSRVPLFTALPSAERTYFAARLRYHRYQRGDALFHEGDPADSLYLVCSGHLKVVVTAPTGEEAVLALFGPDDFFGELALIDGQPRSASVIALERSELWQLHHDDFRDIIRRYPDVAELMLYLMAERIRHLNEQLEQAYFHDLRSRLAEKLLQLGAEVGSWNADGLRIGVPLTQSDLAAMVGASRQKVNQLLSQWRDQRIIRWEQRALLIMQPDRLRVWEFI